MRLVCPLPGVMPSRVNTLFVKFASDATSNTYDSGRTPLVDALFTISVIGCLSTAIFVPAVGATTVGAVMLTPGIGPCTVGVKGFELFVTSHAVTDTTAAQSASAEEILVIITCTLLRIGRIVPENRPCGALGSPPLVELLREPYVSMPPLT